MLRSLDTLNGVVNSNTNLILRTDAAPFNVLVQGPAGLGVTQAEQSQTQAQAPAPSKKGKHTP
jgi:membrane protease subunit HflC